MLSTIFVIIALTALIIGSLTDLDRREVPDWLNYFVLIVAIASRILESVINTTFEPILFGAIGLGIAYAFSAIMYYTGQWGGGDAKMLIALGALFGSYTPTIFKPIMSESILPAFAQGYNVLFVPILIFNILLVGSIYGLLWMSVLAIKHRKKFVKTYKKLWVTDKRYMYVSIIAVILIPIGYFIQSYQGLALMILGLSLMSFGPAIIFGRAIEKTCMIQKMNVSKLTEGEWIVKDVKHKGELVCSQKDLGVTQKQISRLKQLKITSVTVKIGVPFIPAFLGGFIVTIIWGNLIEIMLLSLF